VKSGKTPVPRMKRANSLRRSMPRPSLISGTGRSSRWWTTSRPALMMPAQTSLRLPAHPTGEGSSVKRVRGDRGHGDRTRS